MFDPLTLSSLETEAGIFVGVNYGMQGNNLPPPIQVVALLKSRSITRLRLFFPNHDALQPLQNSGIEVILGTLNQDLQMLGSDISFAKNWVNTNVIPYSKSIRFPCISAGNEVIPGDLAAYVFPAMKNPSKYLCLNRDSRAFIPAFNGGIFERCDFSDEINSRFFGSKWKPSACECVSLLCTRK